MLLPLACPPIIWAGSGLFISQKDEIRTTSGVPSDPSYLVGEVPPWGNPNSTVVLKHGYLCLVVWIVRAFALSPTSTQTWKQKCVYCPVGSKLCFVKLSEFAHLGERSLWIFMGDSKTVHLDQCGNENVLTALLGICVQCDCLNKPSSERWAG